jgi:hypothetical protein
MKAKMPAGRRTPAEDERQDIRQDLGQRVALQQRQPHRAQRVGDGEKQGHLPEPLGQHLDRIGHSPQEQGNGAQGSISPLVSARR